jgi:hypothetical protein
MLATRDWNSAVRQMKAELAAQTGTVFCFKDGWDGFSKDEILLKRILCDWWVTPLSILLAPQRRIQSLMAPGGNIPFRPIDPLDPSTLPSMRFAPVDYGVFLP